MTPNQQVLSDEQIAALKKGPAQAFLEFARAIESATLAALAQQAQEPVALGLPIHNLRNLANGLRAVQAVDKRFIASRLDEIADYLRDLEQATQQPQPAPVVPAPVLADAVKGASVAAVLGDIVALWDLYAPSQHMTAMHMHARRALAGQQPVSPDMHRWCAYVGGMVAHWVMSEPNAHVRLGDEQFEAAISGIIERRLWAMPKRDTTPQPAPPVPVDAFAEGWRMAADWANRDDLLPDMDSPQYTKERDERLADLRPQAAPMTELHPLMIFARECELGTYMEHETPMAARKAINAAKALGITAPAGGEG